MTRLVCMLVFDDAQSLDICGPLEVFALASRQAQEDGDSPSALYEVQVIARDAGPVRLAAGVRLLPDATCAQWPAHAHTLLRPKRGQVHLQGRKVNLTPFVTRSSPVR